MLIACVSQRVSLRAKLVIVLQITGACEGTLSCSTCHVIVDPDWYDKIPGILSEEEQDLLDQAFGLTDK